MIKPFKKLCLILLATILCISPIVLAACGGDKSSSPADTDSADTTLAAEETVTENPFDPKLPEKDYGGANFTILTKGVAAYNEWGEMSIWTESETERF